MILAVLFGVLNIVDRHFIARRAETASKAATEERKHLIHLIAAKSAGEVVTLERSTKAPAPRDPEQPSFRHNPIS